MMDYKNVHRLEEVRELIAQCWDHQEAMSVKDLDFFSALFVRVEEYGDDTRVSQDQLFWLRDIRDRYAL